MKTVIIKTMSEKEKSLAQCSHSIIASIVESTKGNPKSNSPNKSHCSEVFSNIVEVSKKTLVTNYQQSTPKITDKEDPQILLYKLKVPIVIILEIQVGTQIPKILRRFLC